MAFISNGTTILDAGAFDVSLGGLEFISEATASSSASISFTSGIDSTYDVYYFEFINIHPSVDSTNTEVNFSTDSGSNWNVTKTTTVFRTFHNQNNDADYAFGYHNPGDLAQSTSYQRLISGIDNVSYANGSGHLYLFNPSSTTYVKHFIARTNSYFDTGYSYENYIAGYCNTTSAVNGIIFRQASGNIDAGTIKMYGIKGS